LHQQARLLGFFLKEDENMADHHKLAVAVGSLIGGRDNVASVTTCTTRLRFRVRDETQVDFTQLAQTPGVLQAFSGGGQVQVVIGTDVDRVRDALLAQKAWKGLAEETGSTEGSARRKPLDAVFDFLGGTFQPLIPAITGAAMVQVLVLLLTQFGALDAASPTASILNAAGSAVFYFLPILVAFTASRKLGANPFIGAVVAAALLTPAFTAIGETGTVTEAFGLPLFVYSYASSMFPALLVALALSGLERVLKRWIPQVLQQILVPTLEIVLLVPLTALVFGPIGVIVGQGIGNGTQWLSTTAPWLFYIIVPALWVLLVVLGIHWALISIAIGELGVSGSSLLLGAAVGYQYAILGVALAMLIRTFTNRAARNARAVSITATVSAAIGGITEPTIYGLLLRYRRLLIIEVITAAAAGAVLGVFNSSMNGFTPAPILGIPIMSSTVGAIAALGVALVVPIVLVQIWGHKKAGEPEAQGAAGLGFGAGSALQEGSGVSVGSPMTGTVVPLGATGDPVFAAGLIGPGVSIVPTADRAVAPADATVVSVPDSAHAIGLRTDDGVEVLIHVGIDTVRLAGKHFTLKVTVGQKVKKGDVLVEFDTKAITAAGYSMVSPVVVTNLPENEQLDPAARGSIVEGAPLFTLTSKAQQHA
jgi:beta-glucoside PTS system EIICBA component